MEPWAQSLHNPFEYKKKCNLFDPVYNYCSKSVNTKNTYGLTEIDTNMKQ